MISRSGDFIGAFLPIKGETVWGSKKCLIAFGKAGKRVILPWVRVH
jgi:hypothetical protein